MPRNVEQLLYESVNDSTSIDIIYELGALDEYNAQICSLAINHNRPDICDNTLLLKRLSINEEIASMSLFYERPRQQFAKHILELLSSQVGFKNPLSWQYIVIIIISMVLFFALSFYSRNKINTRLRIIFSTLVAVVSLMIIVVERC